MYIFFELPLIAFIIVVLGIIGIFAQFTINDIIMWTGMFVILVNVVVWILTFRESLRSSTVFSMTGIIVGLMIIWFGQVYLPRTLVWDFIVDLLFG